MRAAGGRQRRHIALHLLTRNDAAQGFDDREIEHLLKAGRGINAAGGTAGEELLRLKMTALRGKRQQSGGHGGAKPWSAVSQIELAEPVLPLDAAESRRPAITGLGTRRKAHRFGGNAVIE